MNQTKSGKEQATSVDISKIIAAKQEWEATVDALPQLICLLDENGHIIRANRTVERWNLARIQDVARVSLHQLLHPDCHDKDCEIASLWNLAMASLEENQASNFEINDRVRDAVFDIQFQPIQHTKKTENRSFASIIITDITVRKQMENEINRHVVQSTIIQKVEEELTTTLDIAHVMRIGENAFKIVADDVRVAVILLDESAQIKQYSAAEFSLQDIQEILQQEFVRDSLATATIKSSSVNQWKIVAMPMVSRGEVIGLIYLETDAISGFETDSIQFAQSIQSRFTSAIVNAQLYETSLSHIAELKLLNEEISNLEQIKTDMIRLASHDLRNPLASIQLSIDIMKRHKKDNMSDVEQRHFSGIGRGVATMKSIINDILSLERIEAISKQKLVRVDMVALASQVYANFDSQAQAKSLNYRLHTPHEPLFVDGDETLLLEIMGNFISNAIKYTPEGQQVDVFLAEQNQTVELKVVDTGMGIPTGDQSSIFQPFFRSKNATESGIKGMGLGLNVTKNMIERLSGTVIFDSVLNQGSSFGFTIPLASPPESS